MCYTVENLFFLPTPHLKHLMGSRLKIINLVPIQTMIQKKSRFDLTKDKNELCYNDVTCSDCGKKSSRKTFSDVMRRSKLEFLIVSESSFQFDVYENLTHTSC